MPDRMTHIDVPSPGGPEAMRVASGPVPVPKPGEVLVRVEAAGVNRPDVSQRAGAYPPPPGASPILGLEIAGEIVAAEAADRFRIGSRVCALANGGGYAEYCAVPETQCLPWPAGYDAVRAAALPETMFTVWANLVMLGGLGDGSTALVHGGSSGIGTTAIAIGKELGARVFVTVGSPEKAEACLALGADAAIDYRREDFVERVRALTDGRGVDVVLDMVAGPYIPKNLRCLAMDGRLVLIAFLQGPKVEAMDFTAVMTKRLRITGSTMRPRTAAQKAEIAAALAARMWPALDAGRCAPVIHQVFPLAEAAAAHRLMESSAHIGKIMLRIG